MKETLKIPNSSLQQDIDLEIIGIINNIEDLDRYIQGNTDKDIEHLNIYSLSYLIIDITKVLKDNLKYYSSDAKEITLVRLKQLYNLLMNIKGTTDTSPTKKPLSFYYSPLSEVLPSLESYKNVEFNTNIILNQVEINRIFNEIKLRQPTLILPTDLLIKYENSSEDEKKIISSKIIRLRNEIIKPKSEISSEFIEDIVYNLNLTLSSIGLSDKLKKIDNTYEILDQVNIDVTDKSVKAIESGYKDEAKKLLFPIRFLNIAIILIFILIILVISLKFYAYFIQVIDTDYKPEGLIKFFIEIGKNPSDFIFFFSLIFSVSALETYLIKERKRLIKLKDYFLFCDLELTSMPKYMRELNLNQKQDLYINLSKNYFKGGDHEAKPQNENTDTISDVLKKVEELTKIVKEFKN